MCCSLWYFPYSFHLSLANSLSKSIWNREFVQDLSLPNARLVSAVVSVRINWANIYWSTMLYIKHRLNSLPVGLFPLCVLASPAEGVGNGGSFPLLKILKGERAMSLIALRFTNWSSAVNNHLRNHFITRRSTGVYIDLAVLFPGINYVCQYRDETNGCLRTIQQYSSAILTYKELFTCYILLNIVPNRQIRVKKGWKMNKMKSNHTSSTTKISTKTSMAVNSRKPLPLASGSM